MAHVGKRAVYENENDRGDLWLSNKTKFSFIGPLNRAKNHSLVQRFSEKNREKMEISWD